MRRITARCTGGLGAALAALACAGPLDGPPARSGRYTCASGATFTVDADGVLDNGDHMDCETGEGGAALRCHGLRRDVTWRELPDHSVETDVIARLYGETSPPQRCTWAPLAP